MSVMEKRLQLLLDAHRWELVSRAAAEGHRSAASVIRSAIDLYFDEGDAAARRDRALQAWLESTEDPDSSAPEQTWAEVKAELEADYDRQVDKKAGAGR